jgi:hypothetical protein
MFTADVITTYLHTSLPSKFVYPAMALSDYFELTENPATTHTWVLRRRTDEAVPIQALADELADLIVQHRTHRTPRQYQAWRTRFAGGMAPPPRSAAFLRALLGRSIGLPDADPPFPTDHLEGFVAEHLWYFLAKEAADWEPVVHIEPPSFSVTDQGGDSLIIHSPADGQYMFRLWEIKKLTGNASVSETIGRAYTQLDSRAMEYLARYVASEKALDNEALEDFYGRLMDLWTDADPAAAAGVAVNTSCDKIPDRCFTTFGDRFPRLTNPVRLRGMLTAVGDFGAFATRVQEAVWRGL